MTPVVVSLGREMSLKRIQLSTKPAEDQQIISSKEHIRNVKLQMYYCFFIRGKKICKINNALHGYVTCYQQLWQLHEGQKCLWHNTKNPGLQPISKLSSTNGGWLLLCQKWVLNASSCGIITPSTELRLSPRNQLAIQLEMHSTKDLSDCHADRSEVGQCHRQSKRQWRWWSNGYE